MFQIPAGIDAGTLRAASTFDATLAAVRGVIPLARVERTPPRHLTQAAQQTASTITVEFLGWGAAVAVAARRGTVTHNVSGTDKQRLFGILK